jgi:hypothetical protein
VREFLSAREQSRTNGGVVVSVSVKQTNELWRRICEPRRKHLLHAICDCADDEGRAFPSVNYLVWKTDLPRSTVIQYMQEFRRLGILQDVGMRSEVETKVIAHSERDTKVVVVRLDELPAKLPWRAKQKGTSPVAGPGESGSQTLVVRWPDGASPAEDGAIRKNRQESSEETPNNPVRDSNVYGAEGVWQSILQKLAELVNPHSYDTWFKPTHGVSIRGNVLFVRVPTTDFRHMGTKYAALLENVSPHLKVRFLAPGEISPLCSENPRRMRPVSYSVGMEEIRRQAASTSR